MTLALSLKKILTPADPSKDEETTILAKISEVEAKEAAANESLARLALKRNELLRADDDEGLDRLDQETDRLHRIIDKAALALPQLREELEAARNRTSEATRIAACDEAQRLMKAAEKALQVEYVGAARKIVEVLGTVAGAIAAVEAANRSLPPGRAPIELPYLLRRGPGAQPEEIISTNEVQLWTYDSSGEIVRDQSSVISVGGYVGSIATSMNNIGCTKKTFLETTYHPARDPVPESRLDQLIELPGLLATHAPFWTPGSAYAEDVAADVRASLAEPRPLKPVDPPREVRVRREALD